MNNIFFQTETGYVDYITRDGFTINLVNPLFSEENYKFWSYPYESFMTDEFKREFQNLALLNKSKTIKKIDIDKKQGKKQEKLSGIGNSSISRIANKFIFVP